MSQVSSMRVVITVSQLTTLDSHWSPAPAPASDWLPTDLTRGHARCGHWSGSVSRCNVQPPAPGHQSSISSAALLISSCSLLFGLSLKFVPRYRGNGNNKVKVTKL